MKPNVLLVVLDSVRAGNTSLHGHEHETTPFLESFAETATVYEQARSPGTWSLPSHASMFTGYDVVEHEVTRAKHALEPGHTIFERLRDDHEYRTGVFSENTWITDMAVGLKDAFDTVEGARNLPYPDAIDPSNFVLSEGQGQYAAYLRRCLADDHPIQSLANGVVTKLAWDYPQYLPDALSASTPASVYADLFLDWTAETDAPWAACVNFMDGHLPYEPDPEHDQWGGETLRELQDEMGDQVWEFNGGRRPWWQRRALEGLYDGTIHQMDTQLRRVIETLADRGELDDTLVVVTADHGEGFGEPSRVRPGARVAAHGAGIHEALLHVPLVVRPPGGTDGDRVESAATLTRFPTAVERLLADEWTRDVFCPDGLVVASSHGLEEPMEERASRYCGDLWRFNGDARAVYSDDGDAVRKDVTWRSEAATVRCWDAKTGRRVEETDAAERVGSVFDERESLGVRTGDGGGPVDEATQRRLEDLGYA
ncbi:sulfatase-like hydrolase/transferase [Halobaculum sp. MBLA0147]|uniref:sulfatase-like hydrolase/transferase n=1 Tax=Halobaculum sp. MBLA0147 TaxID=3079934 RepID=UPI0035232E3F